MKETSKELELYRAQPPGFPQGGAPEDLEPEVHLRDYWRVIVKRKWTVLTFFAVIVTTVMISTFLMRPVFTATTTIQIDKESPVTFNVKEAMFAYDFDTDQYYQTQHKLLKSRALAKRVADTLSQDAVAQVSQTASDGVIQNVKALLWPNPKPNPAEAQVVQVADPGKQEEDARDGLSGALLGGLEVKPEKGTRLVRLSYDSFHPEMAALVVNTYSKAFIEMSLENRFNSAQQTRDFLARQIEEMKVKLEQSEEKLNQYAASNEIIQVDEKQNTVTQKLAALNADLTKVEQERIQKEALYRQLQAQGEIVMTGSEGKDDPTGGLYGELARAEVEYQQLARVYKADYPKMQTLERRIKQLKASLSKKIRSEYEYAVKREQMLKAALKEQRDLALKLNERGIQYNILKREVDTNKELYNSMLQRIKEVGVAAGVTASNIQVVDKAIVPGAPSKPNKQRNLLLAILVGLMGGVGLAFFFEYLDNTIKTPEDLDRFLRIPALGLIPSYARGGENGGKAEGKHHIQLIAHLDIKSSLSEAFRTVRTSVLFSTAPAPRRILVTSSRLGEGKTTTAINLAITLAQMEAKVLLIDCDLRRPSCHEVFGYRKEPGLTNYLVGSGEYDDIVRPTEVPNLFVIPSGPVPPNPIELLGSPRMRELIEMNRDLFEYLVIDSPPVLGLADAVVLATLSDGLVLVVRAGLTPRDIAQRAKRHLRDVNARIIGAVLNDVDVRGGDYAYYSYYYYGYGYGRPADSSRKRLPFVGQREA